MRQNKGTDDKKETMRAQLIEKGVLQLFGHFRELE